MEHKKVLRVLSVGFGLATVLLAAAGYINWRNLRAIQAKNNRLIEERLPIEGLIEALDRENGRLGPSLLRLTREALAGGPRQLASVERAIAAHTGYMHATSELLRSSYRRTAEGQRLMGERSRELESESITLLALCVLLGAALGAVSIYLTDDALRRLRWRTEELARVSWHMLEGQEAAARRFSHEMHDELGQILTATRCTIAAVTPEEFAARRASYLEALDQALSATREMSQLLRPVILDDFGLDEALRWLSEGFADRTGIVCRYASECHQRFAGETETHLFRIAQESLTNIARHSGATEAAVRLARSGAALVLTIEDNGRGLPPKEERKGPSLGVIGMRARAQQMGGELRMERGERGGVRVRVMTPVSEQGEDVAA